MPLLYSLLSLALLLSSPAHATADIDALRRLMVDSRFIGLVSPCNTGGSTRTTAAEWLRTAFHDAAPHDASTGQGGIDGSVAYEFDRVENGGQAIPATVKQYRSFQQPGVSLADLIVLGSISAVGSCGGPINSFRPGRTDARQGDSANLVPLPEQSLQTHQSMFERMGFSQTEMISLVGCGHTLGGVHGTANPSLTSAKLAAFDSTRAAFDNVVAVEYINGSLVNPLAQPYDSAYPGRSSDSRIFASDGNVTMRGYANSASRFKEACSNVFQRMYDDAVPSGTSLSSALTPFPVSLGFTVSLRAGSFKLNIGSARLFNMVGKWSSVDIVWAKRDGSLGDDTTLFRRNPRTISNGLPIEVKDFSTRTAIDPTTGISSASVRLIMNDGSLYRSGAPDGQEIILIDDSIIIDTGEAFTCTYSSSSPAGLNVTVAVLGPYRASDRVTLLILDAADATMQTFLEPKRMDYRGPREGTPYNYYNIFVADASSIGRFGARVTRADGTVSSDTAQNLYYRVDSLDNCPANGVIFPPGPRPSGTLSSGSTTRRRAATRCHSIDHEYCLIGSGTWACVDTQRSLTNCGGCVWNDVGAGGRDCSEEMMAGTNGTSYSGMPGLIGRDADLQVQCIRGECVFSRA